MINYYPVIMLLYTLADVFTAHCIFTITGMKI